MGYIGEDVYILSLFVFFFFFIHEKNKSFALLWWTLFTTD